MVIERLQALVAPASQVASGEAREEVLGEVEPGGVGGRVQGAEALPLLAGEEALHLLRDVGRGIVPHEVDGSDVRQRVRKLPEELDGLVGLVPPSGEGPSEDEFAGARVDGDDEAPGAVADVVLVDAAGDAAGRRPTPAVGQTLRQTERLDAGLLVHAHEQFVVGEVAQIRLADRVTPLRVVGPVLLREQVVALPVRLDLGASQDALDRRAAHADALGLGLLDDHALEHPAFEPAELFRPSARDAQHDRLVPRPDAGRTSRSARVPQRRQRPALCVAPRPQPDRVPGDVRLPGGRRDRQAPDQPEPHDPSPHHQPMLRLHAAHHAEKLPLLVRREDDLHIFRHDVHLRSSSRTGEDHA